MNSTQFRAFFFIIMILWGLGDHKNICMEKELCPECHKGMKVDKYIDETTVTMKCSICHKTFKFTYDEKKIPRNINSFNWGAFIMWPFWGFGNGMIMLSIFGLILGFFSRYPFLNVFILIIEIPISLYLGCRGNRLSWEKKNWSSAIDFEKQQKVWTIIAFTLLALCFIIGFISGLS